jgi:hypothetical protein
MKTFKILLLSFITFLSISCEKDEQPEPTLYGKWEYHHAGRRSTTKTVSAVMGYYPGNVPGCKMDYLNFERDKTVLHGDFQDGCEQYINPGTWSLNGKILTLQGIEEPGRYEIEYLDNTTLKLAWYYRNNPDKTTQDKVGYDFYIFKRPQLEL